MRWKLELPGWCAASGIALLSVTMLPVGARATTGAVTTYALPTSLYGTNVAWELAPGPDGQLWFTETDNDQVSPYYWHLGRLDRSGAYSDFRVAKQVNAPGSRSTTITRGPDGNIWFARIGSVGKVTATYSLTQYSVPNATSPASIIAGLHNDLWFIESGGAPGSIARMTTDGVLSEFPIAQGIRPGKLALGADGNVWFCSDAGIARLLPTGEVQVGSVACNGQLAPSADGNIWSGPDFNGSGWHIYRIGMDFSETVFPFVGAGTQTIAPALDGNVWVLSIDDAFGSNLIKVAHDGSETEYPVNGGCCGAPPNAGGLATGPDGSLWFSIPDLFVIGRFEVDTLALKPITLRGTHGRALTSGVGTMFDTDLTQDPSQYQVLIDWGDRHSAWGLISGSNPYVVIGRHTYAASGDYRVLVMVHDRDGSNRLVITRAVIT